MLRDVKYDADRVQFTYIQNMSLMKRKTGLMVGLIVVALAGLIVIQGILLQEAIASREKTFDNTVFAALNRVQETVETVHTMTVMFEVSDSLNALDSIHVSVETSSDLEGDSLMLSLDAGEIVIGDSTFSRIVLMRKDTLMFRDSNHDAFCIPLPPKRDTGGSVDIRQIKFEINDSTDGDRRIVRKEQIDSIPAIMALIDNASGRDHFIRDMLSRLWVSEKIPTIERLDSALIDSTIDAAMKGSNVDLDYQFGVRIEGMDTLLFAPTAEADILSDSKYRVRLFPYDVLGATTELLIHFPNRRFYLWGQVLPMLMIIGAFILIIIGGFVYTVRVIVRQQRTQRLMTDFVNNMTHEFKTPISTIALASEAIMRSDVISDHDKIERFSRMIQDENRRMRNQAEKILQMASLEEGSLRLKKDEVDLKQIIREAVENATLAIKAREGEITCSFRADEHIIPGDRVHLGGIINNLLDNAVKYSREKPEISISTMNADGGIYIRITDRGIGISENDLRYIFNKYYRVSTGDIHDVKGFGLGLSYVKLMVEAHRGTIIIGSKPGEGTQVEIFLPQMD